MVQVDIRWRPSGGRGEYEVVPSEALLNKQIVIDVQSVKDGYIETDVRGQMRDGKPRLRRDHPNDRQHLNVPPLVAALAWLPAPIREDKGILNLPLTDKGYVAASITFDVSVSGQIAFARPLEMKVLHYEYVIDLEARMRRIAKLLPQLEGVKAKAHASEYIALVNSHSASARLAELSELLRGHISTHPDLNVDTGDDDLEPSFEPPVIESSKVTLGDLSAEETTRRLVTHFKIDRSQKLRKAKIDAHLLEHGAVFCENCEFDFARFYPKLGDGFIEVHHKKQLASLMPNEKTFVSDLMLLCSNCHRMVHRTRPPHTPDFLAAHTSSKWTFQSEV